MTHDTSCDRPTPTVQPGIVAGCPYLLKRCPGCGAVDLSHAEMNGGVA